MTAASTQSQTVADAIDLIVAALKLRPAQRAQLDDFVRGLAEPFAKLPRVSFYQSGRNFRVTYRVPGYPKRTERLGRIGKPAYERARYISDILVRVKAKLMKADDAHRILYVDRTPIANHVKAFEGSLRAKGSTKRHVADSITRLNRCIALGGFESLPDIKRESLPGIISGLQEFENPKGGLLSSATINDCLAVLRQFTRWATPRLIPIDPLQNTGGVKNTGKKHRRDVLVEELAEIVAAARRSKSAYRLRGDDRAMLYLAAYATGLRFGELRSLKIEWIKFDASHPFIAVPAEVTKTKKAADQPLPLWFAAELKAWIGKRTGKLFEYLPRDIAPLFEADRAAAREAWIADALAGEDRAASDFLARQTSDGEIVFHSLKHTYGTILVQNLDLKSAQRLTRHATASILADTYAHSRLKTAAEGVEKSIRNPVKQPQEGS